MFENIMKKTYFDCLHEYKIKKIKLINKLKKKYYIFLFDKFFYEIPINWKIKFSLQQISIYKMNIIQKLWLPFYICKKNQIIINKTGNGRILTYLIPIIERSKNFFFIHQFKDVSLIALYDKGILFQIYKNLLFFSKNNTHLLFMFIIFPIKLNNNSKFLYSNVFFTIFKYIFLVYKYYENLLKFFQIHFNHNNIRKTLKIIKHIYNKKIKCNISIFTCVFFIPKYCIKSMTDKLRIFKIYNFNTVYKLKIFILYVLYIHKSKWLFFLLSIVKINPHSNFMFICKNKNDVILVHSIMKGIFDQKKILCLFKKKKFNDEISNIKQGKSVANITITYIKFINQDFEMQKNWTLFLISETGIKDKKIRDFFMKIIIPNSIRNVVLISSEKTINKKIHGFSFLWEVRTIKKIILLNFFHFARIVIKNHSYIKKIISKIVRYKLYGYLYSYKPTFYNKIKYILIS
uniref:RNA helicase n=1 Tax=Lotharella vacuolata TaxID=74820 RepID=A0A0H5BLC0_9EUKA|nr:RNA helicase [Lotharella vacuolata]